MGGDIEIDPIRVIPEAIPRMEKKLLCAAFLEAVIRFYEVPENMVAYEEWRAGKGGRAFGEKNGGGTASGISDIYPAEDGGEISRHISAPAVAAGGGGP